MRSLRKVLVVLVAFAVLGSRGSAFVKPAKEWRVLPDFDARTSQEIAGLSFAESAALARIRAERGPVVMATVEPRDGTVKSIYGMGVPLSRVAPGTSVAPAMAAVEFFRANADLLGAPRDVERELAAGHVYMSEHNGVTHVFLARTIDGIPVYKGELRVHVDIHGEVTAVSAQGLGYLVVANGRELSAADAFVAAARSLGHEVEPVLRKEAQGQALFEPASFAEPVSVRPFLLPMGGREARHVWQVTMLERGLGNWYEVLVDASTGRDLYRYNWTRYIQGRVFDEHPDAGARVMRTFPAGWVASNTTIGNNVSAQEDADNNNSGGARPVMDGSGNFDFPLDLTQDPRNYKSAATTNLFYWNNLIHDWWYGLGFTEPAGNFQTDNFGRGGAGNDAVQADSQDGSGTNNANFATPPDGSKPRMQMYLFTSPNPDRDGDYDADVIVHEYGHGLSNRLVGGPNNTSCLETNQGGAMGEGWGDWFAASIFEDGVMGEYVTQNASTGIRQYNITNSPLTFQDYKNGRTEVHDAGEIWSATLWDVRLKMVAKYGAGAGRTMAEQLVVDGMKLMPCDGGFLDARNGILQADQNLNGGSNNCALWDAFAARGFGASASSPNGNSTSTVVPAFDKPTQCGGVGGATETEPNNTMAQANQLDSAVLMTAFIGTSTDVDYFKLDAGPGTISLTMNVPGNKDYDVKLLNGTGGEVARSERGTGQSETITYNNTANGRFYVHAYGYAGAFSSTASYNVKVTYPAPSGGGDTEPPTVSITSPTEGQTVSGTITVSVTANDNVGVTKVEMWVDSNAPATDTTAPYQFTLNTTQLSNGAHQLRAKAYDGAGNTTTTPPRNINVSNGGSGSMNETEPNGTTGTANTIPSSPTLVTGYIGNSTDVDYFKMAVGAGRSIVLDLTVPSTKDYDLYLYNQNGQLVAYSINDTGQPEHIAVTNGATAQTYYVKVLGYNGAFSTTEPYRLNAQF